MRYTSFHFVLTPRGDQFVNDRRSVVRHTIPKGILIKGLRQWSYVDIEGGRRIEATLDDGTAIIVDDLYDAKDRSVDAPVTHKVTVVPDGDGAEVVEIERRT